MPVEKSTHIIQGVNIRLSCDHRLHSRISNYFNFYYRGETPRLIKPVLYELSVVEIPPEIPAEAVRVLTSPHVTCFRHGKIIYYASEDGSVVNLDTVSRKIEGHLRERVLDNTITLYGLVGGPLADILKYDSLYSLHSAALCHKGTGYLFSGDSGSGKTTSTLGLVANGFKYASDDVVLLEELNGEVIANSLTSTFNVDRMLGARFPGIVKEKDLPAGPGPKITVNIEQVLPGSFVPRLRPDVIVSLKIIPDGKSRIQPLKQAEVFSRLLNQTVLAADKEVSQNHIKTLGKLARQARGFELLSGRDVYEDPGRLVDLISETGCHYADI